MDELDSGRETPESPANVYGSATQRACDVCRTRKCQHAKVDCTYASAKPKEKRSRILLTTQYEKKIDLLDRRLQGVTRLLEDLTVNWSQSGSKPSNNTSTTARTPKSNTSTPYGHATLPSDSDSPLVEGESSLTAHSVFAHEFLQEAVRTSSLQDSSLEMGETLGSLLHIVDTLKKQTPSTEMIYPHARPVQRHYALSCELPPIQKAVALMSAGKSVSIEGSPWFSEYVSMQRLPDLCLSVYFSEDYSQADFIIVNAGLHYLFSDRHARAEGEEKEECLEWAHMCRANLETALANLPLHLPATSDMILALIFGAFHAIEVSKPSLSWTLSSKASELCQTLGYHRTSSMTNDKPKETGYKQLLFWSVYYMDKSLSLRLGRASTIPDWDVTVPLPTVGDPAFGTLSAYFCLWVSTAKCQGNIYEMLYSPDSMLQPNHVRQARAHALVNELHKITNEANRTSQSIISDAHGVVGEDVMDFLSMSDSVLRLSLLTLVHRATPLPLPSTTTFSPDCIDAARATLQRHQDCMAVMNKISSGASAYFPSYVHWTVLFAPFIPFIIVFCQVIEAKDHTDLALLHAFVSSMQSAPGVSEAAGKVYRLFQVLYSVALRYVEFHTMAPPTEQTQANAVLDNYLAELGFSSAIPVDQQRQQQQQQQPQQIPQQMAAYAQMGGDVAVGDAMKDQRVTNPMMWMGNTAQLEDWFNSNQQMIGLLQEPSFEFPGV
ncbi:hypothetical protein G7046_g8006 [Stylonectria norvegica]|nr:hypothetical protein G7046_g8006 [Stylonectria norvegica]